KFSWQNKAVRTSLLVVMFASLFIVPFTTLLPVFARDILDVGAAGQGLLLTAMGVGALGSAIIIAFFGDRMPLGGSSCWEVSGYTGLVSWRSRHRLGLSYPWH